MTRTARASYPRAVIRDRSVSRTGLDGHMQKGGAGRHNWGDLSHEREYEFDSLDDEDKEYEEVEQQIPNGDPQAHATEAESDKPDLSRSTSSLSAQELQEARSIRKNALKKDIDLATIARTSPAVSTSPPANVTDFVTPVYITHK